MHFNIPYMFECWADLVVHLLLPTKELYDLANLVSSYDRKLRR